MGVGFKRSEMTRFFIYPLAAFFFTGSALTFAPVGISKAAPAVSAVAGEAAEAIAAGSSGQTFEIIDGVRRAKANQLLGNQSVPANIFNTEGALIGQRNLPLDVLRSPNKSAIDMSTQQTVDRYMRIQNGLQQGGTLPPINVTPGSRGVRIEDIVFDATGGAQ